MLAMTYRGPYRVRAEQKSTPEMEHPNDAIVRVTRTVICGSDLHLYHGLVPDTRVGTTFGHEFTGIVEEVSSSVKNLKPGDHVLVPFNISCGACFFCQKELYGNCHDTNAESTAVGAIFGYSHTAGVRVLESIERPTLPHVFGTTLPPSGLSGLLREQAYKYGEAKIHRWLLLLLADRINVVEGLVEDLSKGHIPNVFDEMGLKSELKYNKKAFFKRVFTGVVLVSGLIYYLNQKNRQASSSDGSRLGRGPNGL